MTATVTTTLLRQWLDRFCLAREGGGLSPKTVAWYADRTNWYFRWLDDHPGHNPLAGESVEVYLVDLRRRRSMGTVSANYRSLSVFFAWVVAHKLLTPEDSPMPLVERPRVPQQRVKYVSLSEFEQLLAGVTGTTWGDYRDRVLLVLMYYSGLRVGEVIGLRIRDIDPTANTVYVRRGKGGEDRSVPCAGDLLFPALDRYLAMRPGYDDDHLFLSNDGCGGVRGVLTAEGIRVMLRRRCKETGLRNLNPHSFRHGYAMVFLNAGMQLSAVAATMGHKDTAITTKFYARWLLAGVQREYAEARQRLEKVSR